ncbi:signal peptide-containing protein [Cryptosporidium canis]|nr:signal peptide-containing protein [Cryptosporidium canis]
MKILSPKSFFVCFIYLYIINLNTNYTNNQIIARAFLKLSNKEIGFKQGNVRNDIYYQNLTGVKTGYKESISLCDIGFAILSAPKYFNNRVEDLKNSWLRHLCRNDDSHMSSNYVLVSSRKHDNIPTMIPDCEEDYLNLCCKTLASFEWMVENWPEKKWYMKLDDDTFVVVSSLVDELSSFNSTDNVLIGGQIYLTLEDSPAISNTGRSNILRWKYHGEVIKGIRGGAGYLMSSSLAKLFIKNGKRYLDICNNGGSKFKTFEDISLSLLVTEMVGQRSIKHIPGFHFHNPEISYRSGVHQRGFRPITFHMMHDTSKMEYFDYLLNGPMRPSTYSCGHSSTNMCTSEFDLSISSKYWDPVYFGPLNSANSKILGENAINMDYFQMAKTQNLLDSNKSTTDLGNNSTIQFKPVQKGTIVMSFPKYYDMVHKKISSIFDINNSLNSTNIPLRLGHNSLETEHPCKHLIEMYSHKLRSYYSQVFKGVKEVLFVGFPDHPNRGDSAIFTGALILLEFLNIKIVKVIHLLNEYNIDNILELFNVKVEERAVIFHGGGNFGDLYSHHHELRHVVLNDFMDYKIVMFPQTVFFRNQINKIKTIEHFIKHKGDIFLAARDQNSLETLREMFGEINQIRVELLPDMAFLIGDQRKRRGIPSLDILIHARTDNEAPSILFDNSLIKMNQVKISSIKRVIRESNKEDSTAESGGSQNTEHKAVNSLWIDYLTVLIDDWLDSDGNYNDLINYDYIEKSVSRTLDGMAFLSRANIVITNRLHGHILLTLLGISHIVMGDSFGKLEHFRKTWTATCPLSSWHDDLSDALVSASKKLNQ